jgi:predicted membrane-bound mannosyltransferase
VTTESPPVGDAWGNRLPLPWYVASAGADATSTVNASAFDERYGNDTAPPVVIAEPTHREALADRLESTHEATTYRLGLWNREVVVFASESTGGGA